MTEQEWKTTSLVNQMLDYVRRNKPSPRKSRLFSCACCRHIWDKINAPHRKQAVEVSEKCADGEASQDDRQKMYLRTSNYSAEDSSNVYYATWCSTWQDGSTGDERTAVHAYLVDNDEDAFIESTTPRKTQANMVREIFGNPFRKVDRYWLDGCKSLHPDLYKVFQTLASHAYHTRPDEHGTLNNELLKGLACALRYAGCTDKEIVEHLESDGPHYRGCWALDLILEKS